MNFPSAFADSPLNKQEWKTYWSNELADVFFGGNVVTDSGDPVEVIDETGIYKDLIASSPVTVSYFNKRDGLLFKVTIKVFVVRWCSSLRSSPMLCVFTNIVLLAACCF